MSTQIRWDDEAEVVVVGFGGAGAVAAIAAHDAGAKVLILEKQPKDTTTETRHTPSTRMSAGRVLCPSNQEKTALYFEGMVKIANETLDPERMEMISAFTKYLTDNSAWLEKVGIKAKIADFIREARVDFPELPGSGEGSISSYPERVDKFRDGAALFNGFSMAVAARRIPIMWETAGKHLVSEEGAIRGVIAGNMEEKIRASRGVILTCGGFEFNSWMKENYLRVNPVHFYGNPANTGDGIRMAGEVGATLWHMNAAAFRVTLKFPDHPIAFGAQQLEMASILVDRRGSRFTNEKFKPHAFGYELANYDCNAMCFPRVPCYWIFDEKRRTLAPLASPHGPCNPPGGIMGDIHYIWDDDNQKEIDRGWIFKSNTFEGLVTQIKADPDNGELMSPSLLAATVKKYNDFCRKGEDPEFHKPKESLQPLEDPPFYAVKLWPGGPNTQGGPKRNSRGQVLRFDNSPIPKLYSAGELGSIWGMLYQGGGSLAECVAVGRIAGANAAQERRGK